MLILVDSISRVAAAKAWSMSFCTDRFLGCSEVRAHASNLFIPTTGLWAALKSRVLLGQARFGSRNPSEVSSSVRIGDLYAWTLPGIPGSAFEALDPWRPGGLILLRPLQRS